MFLFCKPNLVGLSFICNPKCFNWYRFISEKVSSANPILCYALDEEDRSGIRKERRGKVVTAEQLGLHSWCFLGKSSHSSKTKWMNDWVAEFTCLWENGEGPKEEENDLDFGCDMEQWIGGETTGWYLNHIKTTLGYPCCIAMECSNENFAREKALALNHRPSWHT